MIWTQNNDLLEAYLTPQGYEVIKAVSGEEALEKLLIIKSDLILRRNDARYGWF